MKILALYDIEDVAILLTDLTMITEVEVVSVPNIEKFKLYLEKGNFNAIYLLDKFFTEVIGDILSLEKGPRAILIFTPDEEGISKFLRLGISELNIETIPFNPLTLFVKTRSLLENLQKIEYAIKSENVNLDFYRHGLFNLLNIATKLKTTGFITVKDLEEDTVLYSLRLRNGQVVSASKYIEEIIKINIDDAIPKALVIEPVQHEDKEIFNGTADFYKQLLEYEYEDVEEFTAFVKPLKEKPQKVLTVKVNPLRERRIYKFPYGDYTVYSQPSDALNEIEDNAVFVVPSLNDGLSAQIRNLLLKKPGAKLYASPLIKGKLQNLGIPDAAFAELPDVQFAEVPFLGERFETIYFFNNGVLVSGNLFGSYVSKDVEFLDRVFTGHLKTFHMANISSNEKLELALEKIKLFVKGASFVLPQYGYPIEGTMVEAAYEILGKIEIPKEYNSIATQWNYLAESYGIDARSYEEFMKKLRELDTGILFNIVDDMEVLGIVPLEL